MLIYPVRVKEVSNIRRLLTTKRYHQEFTSRTPFRSVTTCVVVARSGSARHCGFGTWIRFRYHGKHNMHITYLHPPTYHASQIKEYIHASVLKSFSAFPFSFTSDTRDDVDAKFGACVQEVIEGCDVVGEKVQGLSVRGAFLLLPGHSVLLFCSRRG